jgi:hypothetical protein
MTNVSNHSAQSTEIDRLPISGKTIVGTKQTFTLGRKTKYCSSTILKLDTELSSLTPHFG